MRIFSRRVYENLYMILPINAVEDSFAGTNTSSSAEDHSANTGEECDRGTLHGGAGEAAYAK